MATILQAYDKNGFEIYPKGVSEGIQYAKNMALNNAVSTVKLAIDDLYYEMNELSKLVTGALDVDEKLTVEIKYARNSDITTIPTSWGNSFSLPDENNYYTWKKTVYYWANLQVGDPYYEVVATANYPETQFLFCAVGSSLAELEGPSGYPPEGSDSIKDKKANIYWYTTPQSVGVSAPYAYMASRSRKANLNWDDIKFGFAMYGSYAFNSVTITKYMRSTTNTTPSVGNDTNTGELPESTVWKDSIAYSDLTSGTNYIFQIQATSINGTLVKAYNDNFWTTPSLISIINK